MANILDSMRALFNQQYNARVFTATVTSVSGRTVQFQAIGEQFPVAQFVTVLKSYSTPTNGDVVLVMQVGKGYLVLGAYG